LDVAHVGAENKMEMIEKPLNQRLLFLGVAGSPQVLSFRRISMAWFILQISLAQRRGQDILNGGDI
jgi:hypothetical protein